MEGNTLIIVLVVATAISLAIMYYIIHYAVKTANREVVSNLDILIMIKMAEMKKDGQTDELKRVLYNIEELRNLEKQRKDGYLSPNQYEEKKKQLAL